VDVVLVRWPTEALRRDHLAGEGAPRLLLVEVDVVPPDPRDCLEDWIRVPASELRFSGAWVPLPPVEARLMRAMLDRFGAVVSRDALARAGWPDGAPGRNALDVHVLRLRRRLTPLTLAIRTVRSRGYLVESVNAHRSALEA
jgi:hypothetical protein